MMIFVKYGVFTKMSKLTCKPAPPILGLTAENDLPKLKL